MIGKLLTHDALEKLERGYRAPTLDWAELDERDRQERNLDLGDLDRRTSGNRANAATRIGPKLLMALLDELSAPLRRQLALEIPGRGGRPVDTYRRNVVQALITVHCEIYHKSPTATPHRAIHGAMRSRLRDNWIGGRRSRDARL